jgi:6-pyruvoyltetrahydropterin/6-carboxytetrahydropterin synthase
MGKFRVRVRHSFSGAHFLKNYKGKVISGELNGEEYVVDFLEVKGFLKNLLPPQVNINDILPGNPTTERLAEWIFKEVKKKFPGVEEVIVWETEKFGASYSE